MLIQNIISPVIAYFIGSIPFGYLITKFVKDVDIRQIGSGNPGATNVARALGKPYGILVFFLDMLKGFLPVYFFDRLFSGYGHNLALILCGVGVICGHTFPIFLGFKGGKAAATGSGVFLWLAPVPLFIAVAVWSLTVFISRYISLGSMISSISLVASLILFGKEPFRHGLPLTLFSIFISMLLIVRHKSNIKRILNGTESKIGKKVKSPDFDEN